MNSRRRFSFDRFKSKLLPCADSVPVDDNLISKYREIAPPELITHWQTDGLRCYGNGLLWFGNPDSLGQAAVSFSSELSEHLVFARTAFGDLYSTKNDSVYLTQVQTGEVFMCSKGFDIFGFLSLHDDEYVEGSLLKPLFVQASKKLGPISSDECYAFTPALVLGGDGTLETLKKVKLSEYLDILSQLHR